MYLRNVQKLMAQFERQMAALDKHRGKGHQTLTIEPSMCIRSARPASIHERAGAVEAGPLQVPIVFAEILVAPRLRIDR